MKATLARQILIAFLVVICGFVAYRWTAGPASAGSHQPKGDSPADALTDLCTWQSLPPLSHVWYRIPQGNEGPVIVTLMSYPRYIDGLRFQVYAAKFTADGKELDPWGSIGCSSKTSSRIVLQWLGQPIDGEIYYVDVANDNPFIVGYSLCHRVNEWDLLTGWE